MAQEPINQQAIAIIRSVGGLTFDATFEEVHESALEVTDNPVESGVVVSDHAYMQPLRLVISAGVSDTPLRLPTNDKFSQGESRSRNAFNLLAKLQASAEPFDIQTGFKLYKNMVCTRINAPQSAALANAFEFTAEFREVIIVKTETVTYPARRKAGATSKQASKKKQKGEQQAKEPTEQKKPAVKKSILKSLVG